MEKAPSPAANHLFAVNENDLMMSKAGVQLFHHIVTKMLFLCKKS